MAVHIPTGGGLIRVPGTNARERAHDGLMISNNVAVKVESLHVSPSASRVPADPILRATMVAPPPRHTTIAIILYVSLSSLSRQSIAVVNPGNYRA